ncbi:hypothetical protein EG868_10900 [Enterococcus faecalis]|uniref:hypothetical protein n=1 Tax=Enterococcus faecalis TaxID=1351 RepID=UPI000FFE81E4|nr:hypothetical protein [Enterococcus faecalis]RXF31476.1 hypothetical protein EG868_10900 [Enterococcus faecalis]
MSRDQRISNDFEHYKEFLKEYFPKFDSTEEKLYDFYLYVNNSFVLCDLLIEHNKIDEDCNYFNILIEYREFYARLLTTVAINDKFLVDNLLRVIIEKVYRILYGMLKNNKLERSIRRESRSEMKKALEGNVEENRFNLLNTLYNEYSQNIHHTISIPTDYFNLTRRLEHSQNNIEEFVNSMEKIEQIFLDEIFLILSPDNENEETSYKMKIRNNTSDYVIRSLNLD